MHVILIMQRKSVSHVLYVLAVLFHDGTAHESACNVIAMAPAD